ncbi:MAG: hypothetical protein JW747_08425 [Candidatus Aminicenantes bacterium]|nr:hypothetical protein [Candidatus Aminicenantes bacterium]
MKNARFFIPVVLALAVAVSLPAAAEDGEDMQAIKKAVKENPAYEAGKPAQWFKVLITDSKTGQAKVKITLPLSLMEVFVKCADEGEGVKIDREGLRVDLKELFAELKKLGPMMFIEVYEEDETVKIWLE